MNFTGTAGNDMLVGTSGDDIFDMSQGGDDNVDGGDGNDTFNFGNAFTGADIIAGGNGADVLSLDGDYHAGVTFNSANVAVEKIVLAPFHHYTLTDSYLANGSSLTVDGSALTAKDPLNFQAQTSDGRFFVTGGAADDIIDTGAGSDTINGGAGDDSIRPGSGNNIVKGADGNDFISFAGPNEVFNVHDVLDGGNGFDAVNIDGTYASMTFTTTTLTGIEDLAFIGGSFNVTTNDANVAAGQTLFVSAASLSSAQSLTFHGAAETDGSFDITGGAGADTLIGGNNVDRFTGGGGADRFTGGGGGDLFLYNAVSDSTSTTYDHISDFNAAQDFIHLPVAVTGIDPTIMGGVVNAASFDANLASVVSSTVLLAHHAMLLQPGGGDLHGHLFLVVDANGVAGYQASQDLVVEVTGMTGALTTGNFV
ncbi:MAG TPA: calcium-binding protein [Rhizomicrobium sp.]|jgi:Ca2+-binding RTX toxin-like protein